MATPEHSQAPAPPSAPSLSAVKRALVAATLRRALGGLYAPAREDAALAIVCAALAAGGPAAMVAFLDACRDAAALTAAGQAPAQTLSRAHAGDARAHEGAPGPAEGEEP